MLMRSVRLVVLVSGPEKDYLTRKASMTGESLSVYVRQTLLKDFQAVEAHNPASPALRALTCKQCGNVWTPKVPNPKQCPTCKGAWNKSRAKSYAEVEAEYDAISAAIGITPDEYNRQDNVVISDMTIEEMRAHHRRWERIQAESGVSLATWEAAKWASRNPSVVAATKDAPILFDAIKARMKK